MGRGDDVSDEPTEPEIPPPVDLPPPVEPRVTAPPVATEPPASRAPLLDKTQWIVMGVGVVVVIVLAAAIVVFSTNNDNSSGVTFADLQAPAPAAAATPTAPATDAPVTAPPATVVSLRAVATKLDAELTQSAAQVGELKNVIAQFAPTDQACGLSGAAAAAQTGAIIDQRKKMVTELDALANTSDASAKQLVTQLRTAIDLSLQSDYPYQSWMSANASTDATNPCARVHDANWQAAQTIAPRAGDAKKAFVAAYNPVAASLGLRANWTYTDF